MCDFQTPLRDEMNNEASFFGALRVWKIFADAALHHQNDAVLSDCKLSLAQMLNAAERDRRDFYATIDSKYPDLRRELLPTSARSDKLPYGGGDSSLWVTNASGRLPRDILYWVHRPPSHHAALELFNQSIENHDAMSGAQYREAALDACIAADRDRRIAEAAGLRWNKLM